MPYAAMIAAMIATRSLLLVSLFGPSSISVDTADARAGADAAAEAAARDAAV